MCLVVIRSEWIRRCQRWFLGDPIINQRGLLLLSSLPSLVAPQTVSGLLTLLTRTVLSRPESLSKEGRKEGHPSGAAALHNLADTALDSYEPIPHTHIHIILSSCCPAPNLCLFSLPLSSLTSRTLTSLPTMSTQPSVPLTSTPTADYPAYEYPANPNLAQPSPPYISGRAAAGYFPPSMHSPAQPAQRAQMKADGPVPPRLVPLVSRKGGMNGGS